MKKILRKRNNKLAPVYSWAVEYSRKKSKERRALKPSQSPLNAPRIAK